eukprot:m.9214 g.9214  ORF g.9214 m.9214 type:complete len:480 (-) comp5433_c0_seq1:108-1547(-)
MSDSEDSTASPAVQQRQEDDGEDVESGSGSGSDSDSGSDVEGEKESSAGEKEPEKAKEDPKTFAELGLEDELCETCATLNYKAPTPIQAQAIPHVLAGKDVIGVAETGSGKTAAFLLPVLHFLLNLERPKAFYAVVMAPTRELAKQIDDAALALGASIGLKTALLTGGMDMTSQVQKLAKRPHIVVATPGRIADHLQHTKGFNLRNLNFLILDEADRMMTPDFKAEMEQLLRVIPRERTTLMFTATLNSKIEWLQRMSLRNPVKVEVKSQFKTVDNLNERMLFMPFKDKNTYFVYAVNELQGNSMIIFCSTCKAVMKATFMLRELGFPAICLHGQMTQAKRYGALSSFTSQKSSILLATDVASRGLDIPHVDVVMNYDVPTHSKDYIHRVGRTARAGKCGKAISFVTQYDVEFIQRIEQVTGKRIDMWKVDKASVQQLAERVSEASRVAQDELKAFDVKKPGKRSHKPHGGKRSAKKHK